MAQDNFITWNIDNVLDMRREIRMSCINEEPYRHFVRGLLFAQDMKDPVFVPIPIFPGREWTGTPFDCDYLTWVPDCPLRASPSFNTLSKTSDGGILSTDTEGCLTFVEDRVKNDTQTRRKYFAFHVPTSAPAYENCGANMCLPNHDIKGNVLVIKVMPTPNHPLDMDIEEWLTVTEILEEGILQPTFTQRTVTIEDTVVSVAKGGPPV